MAMMAGGALAALKLSPSSFWSEVQHQRSSKARLQAPSWRAASTQHQLRLRSTRLPRQGTNPFIRYSGRSPAATTQRASLVENAAPAFEDNLVEGKEPQEHAVSEQANAAEAAKSVEEDELEFEKGFSMKKVCDRLIEVFMVERPEPDEWRKLLAFSGEWKRIRPKFYDHCKVRAEGEPDPRKKANLLKLARRLKVVDDEMVQHDELLAEIEQDETELDVVVARRRKDFTSDFFKHLRVVCDANHSNLDRREKVAELATRCLATVEEYDKVAQDKVSFEAARQKFDYILNSASITEASKKIDTLLRKKQFDATLMLVISKAWASAKESPLMKDEVKEIMYQLYQTAKGNMQKLIPREVRILKHLITIEDPRERLGALAEAFTPGEEVEGKDADMLYTDPTRLYSQVVKIIEAYYNNKENTLIQEAQKLMDPRVINRLEVLRDIIKAEFM